MRPHRRRDVRVAVTSDRPTQFRGRH
jgi:hypothetical protein